MHPIDCFFTFKRKTTHYTYISSTTTYQLAFFVVVFCYFWRYDPHLFLFSLLFSPTPVYAFFLVHFVSFNHACLVGVGWHYKGTAGYRPFAVEYLANFFQISKHFCRLLLHCRDLAFMLLLAYTDVEDGMKILTMSLFLWP